MLPSATVVKKGLHSWYNKSDIGYRFCNKRFKVILEGQMSKDKPAPLLAIKTYSWCGGLSSFYT